MLTGSDVRFKSVTKRYGETSAVDDLNLSIEAGQTTVLVGPSGCGKTTTLRMINRMVEPTSGSIFIGGVKTTTIPKTKLRRSIGYVIQNAGLFPHRTVLQNIMTVPRLNGDKKAVAARKANEMMEFVGLSPNLAARYPAQLSGGQQQRVGVARALAGSPQLMLMDEPFSALDPVVRTELQTEFRSLITRTDTTTVFVTHDIDEAIKVGDKIALFERGGTLAQVGTPADLLRHPVSDHVAEFVGRDRGFRALSFTSLKIDPKTLISADTITVKATQYPDQYAAAIAGSNLSERVFNSALHPLSQVGRWRIVTDDNGAFLGWVETGQNQLRRNIGVIQPEDSLRRALDAVLSAPAGRAALLDGRGRPLGLVTLDHLVASGLLEQNGTSSNHA